MEEYARKNSQLCKEYFDKAAEASTVVDLSELTGFYAYDTVSELTFGEPIGLLEAGRDKAGITHKMEAATENITLWACFNHFNELMYSAPVRFIQALRARGQPSVSLSLVTAELRLIHRFRALTFSSDSLFQQ